MRDYQLTPEKRNKKMFELHTKGVNMSELAKLNGLSRERVRQIIEKMTEEAKKKVLDKD